ncbi:MAG: hypothetical protein HY237_14490 [Acidobacteria bacterium]|nr:hypothetical protein [Acidobacteriota bacterium]
MPPKQELERRDLTELAVLCGKIAERPSADSETIETARGLKEEWVLLVARETPPLPELRLQQEVERQKESLKGRMVDFLAGVL